MKEESDYSSEHSFKGMPDLLEHKPFVSLLKAKGVNIKFLVSVQDARNAVSEHAKTRQYSIKFNIDKEVVEPPGEDRDEG